MKKNPDYLKSDMFIFLMNDQKYNIFGSKSSAIVIIRIDRI